MTKKYQFGRDNRSVIETDEKTGVELFIPYTTSGEPSILANRDYQRVSEAYSEGSIVIEPFAELEAVDEVIETVEKLWFVRALRQLNLKEKFDKALASMSEDLQDDFSIMTTIDKSDVLVKTWAKSAKVKAKELDEVFVTAESLRKANK